jgi:methenyltetrahydromethanopterin cyclohydrolase
MLSVNEYGLCAFEEMQDKAEELNIEVKKLNNGTMVADLGVNVDGGYEAGRYLARICMADLADIEFNSMSINEITVPGVVVTTDHPVISCMASQFAGWRVSVGKYFAMGSGPARALSLNPKKLYKEIEYEDKSDVAVLALEASKLPNEEVADKIAGDCKVDPKNLYLTVAPTASVAGAVNISARIVETGIHKLETVGFDINKIKSGTGICPIAPIVGDDTKCMGATNDCLIYYGRTYYNVEYEIEKVKELIKKVPSMTSRSYGKPFFTTFKESGFDFYKIDAGMFAPAEITINELNSAKSFISGGVNPKVLLESFGIEKV